MSKSSAKKTLNANVTPEGARSTAKGYLTVGLLSAAIKVYKATDDYAPGFKMLHRDCGSTINQKIYCPQCDKLVERDAICKGIEIENPQLYKAARPFVPFEEGELDAVYADGDGTFEVDCFVKEEALTGYVESGNFRFVGADPTQPCDAYRVLFAALVGTGKVGLVSYVSGGYKKRALLTADKARSIFILSDVLYADQVRAATAIPRPLDYSADKEELALARELIKSMEEKPEAIGDNPNAEAIEKFKAAKIEEFLNPKKGGTKPTLTVVPKTPPKDLMAALKASLETKKTGKKKAA